MPSYGTGWGPAALIRARAHFDQRRAAAQTVQRYHEVLTDGHSHSVHRD
ncbi:hypothetical protein SAMN05892883_0007 [Jatrophihabitans sp. GAS493]|nr:hypothetical protein [Jatrophihabitans sp. GAS493]SOD70274.1 hypothetical protein SAMN05892883_0007 [Jatrophihabitans sp. GAS493]